MGVRLALYSTLLLWLLLAAESQESGLSVCEEKCGNVTIPYPFGKTPGCYTNTWFRVTCNETVDGPKIFISRLNMELLGTYSLGSVIVNSSVTHIDCGDKDNEGATTGVNYLTGSPFFFSSKYNVLGSVGCGNLVTISTNQTDPIGGCVQPSCGDGTSRSGCYTQIFENITSYTAVVRDIYDVDKDSKSCKSSVFLFDGSIMSPDGMFPHDINIDTTHVAATLEWNPFKCDLEGALCQKGARLKSTCKRSCGDVEIPYPFGIEDGCYMNEGFRVTCNATGDGLKVPFISSIHLQPYSISFSEGIFTVNTSVKHFNCRNYKDDNGVSVNLTDSPFIFSNSRNVLAATGCGNLVTIFHDQSAVYPIGGCLQPGCGNNVTSFNGCLIPIPLGLSSFAANVTDNKRSCASVFMVDSDTLEDLQQITETSNKTHVQTVLEWGKAKLGLCELKEGSNITCSPDGQYCWSNLSSDYLCICSNSENSGRYGINVCREAGKCGNPMYNYCHMLCLHAPGNYCSSQCPDNYEYDSFQNICKPMKPISPTYPRHLAIIIGCCASIGTLFLLLATLGMYKVFKRRKDIKLKQKYFKRNGGLLLQQQLSSNEGNVEKIRLFASKELEKATDYYNQNRILGEGGQGVVYKGMLTDGSIVAIKKSKMVDEKTLDEKKLEQFINEVIILAQINHRNVVKLLGCCLETKVPLLVYEFIPNGTLSKLVHDQNEEFSLTREMRLRIATEIANALSYLHSAASIPIYHRDVKSSNILLDDKYRAKVSDFGTSRTIALEQTHLTTRVHGTFGYMDPEYFRSSQFTEKSDVYSFGVVLVELLTGQKPICSRQSDEVRSLVSFFLLSMKQSSWFDILDPRVMNDGPQEEIIAVAKLAKRCLNLNGTRRPTMKQVAMELERIRTSGEADVIQQSDDEDSDIEDITEPWAMASCSNTSIMNDTSLTIPLDA